MSKCVDKFSHRRGLNIVKIDKTYAITESQRLRMWRRGNLLVKQSIDVKIDVVSILMRHGMIDRTLEIKCIHLKSVGPTHHEMAYNANR